MTAILAATAVIAPLILGFFFLIGAATLSEKHAPMKIALFLLSIVTFWVSQHVLIISVNHLMVFPALEDLIGTTTYWTGLLFFVIVSYFIIYLIYLLFVYIAEKKKERLEY